MSVSVQKQVDSLERVIGILLRAEALLRGFLPDDTIEYQVIYERELKLFRIEIRYEGATAIFCVVRDYLPAIGRIAGERLLRDRVSESMSGLAKHRSKPAAHLN